MIDYDVMVFLRLKEVVHNYAYESDTICFDGVSGVFIMPKSLYSKIRETLINSSFYGYIIEIQLIKSRAGITTFVSNKCGGYTALQ